MTQTKILNIEGMTCAHCAGAVTKALNAVTGVTEAKVDLETKTAAVTLSGAVTDDALRAAVEEAGYTLTGIKYTANG